MKKDTAYMSFVYAKVKDLERPTFPQFVDYLLRTPVLDFNDHWLPYWLHCQFCRNKSVCFNKTQTALLYVGYYINQLSWQIQCYRNL